ncbi:uncharacterized protein LOC143172845 isoform X2 [Aptenodytes patagonicus]
MSLREALNVFSRAEVADFLLDFSSFYSSACPEKRGCNSMRSAFDLEQFQQHLCMYATKWFEYTYPVYRTRCFLAAIGYNMHLNRQTMHNKQNQLFFIIDIVEYTIGNPEDGLRYLRKKKCTMSILMTQRRKYFSAVWRHRMRSWWSRNASRIQNNVCYFIHYDI